MLAITAGHAIMPLLFSRWASFPKEKLNVHVEKVMRFASTISVFMIVVLQAAAKWIVLILYGRDFLPAVKPMRILVPGTVLYLMSYILIQLLSSRGKPELAGANLLIGAVVNGILTWFLIQVMDIHGAALATTVANVVLLTSLVLTVKKKHGINFSRCIFVNKEDIRSIFKALSWEKTQNV
jgi:O-antigen/teichoic acid export membrane protein